MAVEVQWASAETRFTAMGTYCHVLAVGPCGPTKVAKAVEAVERLELLWSRFRPGSEISQLSHANGRSMKVSPETVSLVQKSVLAWRLSQGRFNPTMANRMVELGYDRSFAAIDQCQLSEQIEDWNPDQSCGQILVDSENQTVRLPKGIGFDPGGIGKGLAADMISAQLMNDGAWGAMVNLGGDLRVRGTPPSGDAWLIAIREPAVLDSPITSVRLNDCGLATSTTKKRRWNHGGLERHHLLDPDTGLSCVPGVDLASVIAGEAWWAEAAATALVCQPETLGSEPDSPDCPPRCAALRVFADRSIDRLCEFERYETYERYETCTY